jgi:carotenoid 1,2-hydratase
VIEKNGATHSIACAFGRDGSVSALPIAGLHTASKTGWRMVRPYRSEAGEHGLIATVEDTPFYARSLVAQIIDGEKVTAIHESLSATRFASPIVQLMLPWRMPRRNRPPAA